MPDLLLAQQKLPSDIIDLAIGEPTVIRKTFLKYFPIKTKLYDLELSYPFPAGYKPLTDLLEKQYRNPVVITCGAKQGLDACLYAVKKLGTNTVTLTKPYWCLLPPLIKNHGLDIDFLENHDAIGKVSGEAFLATYPNNPDNFIPSTLYLLELEEYCKKNNIMLIHDAVYYNEIYLPEDYHTISFGDAQIFSVSKSFGLPGLRCGWVVCRNHRFYNLVQEYIEAQTAGVSIASQKIVHQLLVETSEQPKEFQKFQGAAKEKLNKAWKIVSKLDKDILEIPSGINHGMFGWFKKGPKVDFGQAKVHAINGSAFGGGESFVRINLAVGSRILKDAVEKLCI